MNKIWWKWLLFLGILAASIIMIGKNGEGIRLGLDIKGGYSFTLELDEEALEANIRESEKDADEKTIQRKLNEAREIAKDTAVEVIRARIDTLGTEEPVITRGKNGRIYVQLPGADKEKQKQAEELVQSIAFLEFSLVSARSDEKAQKLLSADKAPKGYEIKNTSKGPMYVRDNTVNYLDPSYKRELRRFGNPDPGSIFMMEKTNIDGYDYFSPIFVQRNALLTGKNLSRARSETDMQTGKPMVGLTFDKQGAKIFSEVTGQYCPNGTRNKNNPQGRRLAIILDDIVYSAPTIQTKIDGGNAVITGAFTLSETRLLQNVLNAGALPAPMKFIGKRFVNPTLGEDSIANAKMAIACGCGAILIFLIAYYQKLGIVASFALIINILLLPIFAVLASGLLGAFSQDAVSGSGSFKLPVLTLPGIAGILLTIGMAVDANVLIYERTREELNKGRPSFPSIMDGYKNAFLAIFDGNVTTVITAIILFTFGTGLIRGFSVTLVAGILASMFTALFVTKLFFRTFMKEHSSTKIKMLSMVPADVKIPFTKYFKKAIICAATLVVLFDVIAIVKGLSNPSSVFDVDFTGGSKITYTVGNPEKAPLEEIRKVAADINVVDAKPQYQQESVSENETVHYLEISTITTDIDGQPLSDALTKALNTKLPEANFVYDNIDEVGSQIGKEMKRTAYIAIILSTIAMLIYITVRFEFGFSLGAIAALTHDVLITVGIFTCLGFKYDLTIVAALLTIVGYGVNDTIVLFDRIREELKKDTKYTFSELTDMCINSTLSRTLLTSITTLITVVALMIFTSGSIFGFATCMFIGIIVSTFSTIFIAAPVMLSWYKYKRPSFEKE